MILIMTILTSIPDPGTIEPLEHKLPKDIGSEGADFTLKCLDKVKIVTTMMLMISSLTSIEKGEFWISNVKIEINGERYKISMDLYFL